MSPTTYIHISIHIYIHTYVHTYTHVHTYIHASIHTYTHAYIHTYIHPSIHTYIHTSIHPYVHTYIHTYISPRSHSLPRFEPRDKLLRGRVLDVGAREAGAGNEGELLRFVAALAKERGQGGDDLIIAFLRPAPI